MKIIPYLQHKFALSHEGAVDMAKACVSVTVTNIVLMMPATVLYLLIKDLLENTLTTDRIPFYVIASIIILVLIVLTNFIQYNATFLSTYKESGVRRTVLAERLRKLPLSYFGKKNIADLTTTIMSDCAQIETASSHWIPELIGALISTALVGVSMFIFFDWRIALASFWVIPAAFLTVWGSATYQKTASRKNNAVKMELADGIQECLETVRDLRANNAQDAYMEELDRKMSLLLARADRNPEIRILYFKPDEKKAGGKTVTITEAVRRIDPVRRKLVLARKKGLAGAYEEIGLDRLVRISCEETEDA
jgi:ATP-binding cassette subfamily B protein